MKRNILKVRLLGALICLALLCLSGATWGSTLSLQTTDGSAAKAMFLQGQDLYLNINIDDMTGVAGCAFTLTFPSAVLEFVGTDANGVSAGITSPVFNFVQGATTTKTHRENTAAGKIMLSGAAIDTTGINCGLAGANPNKGGYAYTGDQILFTIRFKVKADATISNYSFSLGKTTLTNTDAGYPSGGEEIPVLIGAVPCSDPNWGTLSAAFPDKTGELTAFPLASAANFAVRAGSIINDTTPPTGTIAFAEGDATKSLKVNLNIIASDNLGVIASMKIVNGPNPPANWATIPELPFATTKPWTLAAGEGVKTVYARFKDAAGNWSGVAQDDIMLDMKAPVTVPDWLAGGYKEGQYNMPTGLKVTLTATDVNPGSTTYWVVNNPTLLPGKPGWEQSTTAYVPKPDAGKSTTLRFYSKDAAGNVEGVKTALYTNSTDAKLPTGTVKINNGAEATSTESVTLNLAFTDLSGLSLVKIWDDNVTNNCSTIENEKTKPYAAVVTWTLPGAQGDKTVCVSVMDKQNNWSAVASDTILLDQTKPTGTVNIEGGNPYTKKAAVTLTLDGSGAGGNKIVSMKISNANPVIDSAAWKAIPVVAYPATVPATKAWTLAAGEGVKTVYAWFKDAAGNWSGVAQDDIMLDMKAPVTVPDWPAGGYKWPLSVTLTATDANPGVTTYCTENKTLLQANFPVCAGLVPITQPIAPAVSTTLRFYSKDAAGNMEAVKTALYTNSTNNEGPTKGTVKINNDAPYTSMENVTLNLAAVDPNGLSLVKIDNAPIVDCTAAVGTTRPFAAAVPWTLTAGEGSKTVYVCFMDKQNNWSAVASDTILLDQTKPEGSIAISGNCANNFETTTLGTVTLTLSATDTAPGEVAFMQFSNNGTTWPATWEAYKTTRTGWALTTGNGPKTVYARFKDKAGNISDAVLDTIDRAATCANADTFELGKGVAAGGSVYYVGLAGSDGTMKVSWVERGASGSTLTQTLELAGYSFGDALAVDGQGNVYATGVASGILYLAKYDSTGYELWHVQIGTSADLVSALSVRSDGTSYVAKPAAGGGIILSTFNSSGVQQGGDIPLNLPAGDEVYAATRDGAGNIYLAGELSGTPDGFVAGYPAAGGNAQWTQPIGAISGGGSYGLAADGLNNVYVTGYAYGSLGSDINAGVSDCFLAKYDSAGTPQWVRLYGTVANDWGGGVAVDAGNNVWVTGASGVIVGGKPTAGYEMFLLKYDASGILQP